MWPRASIGVERVDHSEVCSRRHASVETCRGRAHCNGRSMPIVSTVMVIPLGDTNARGGMRYQYSRAAFVRSPVGDWQRWDTPVRGGRRYRLAGYVTCGGTRYRQPWVPWCFPMRLVGGALARRRGGSWRMP